MHLRSGVAGFGMLQRDVAEKDLARKAGGATGHLAAADRAEIAPDAGAGLIGLRHIAGPEPSVVLDAEEGRERRRGRAPTAFAKAMCLPQGLGFAVATGRPAQAMAREGGGPYRAPFT